MCVLHVNLCLYQLCMYVLQASDALMLRFFIQYWSSRLLGNLFGKTRNSRKIGSHLYSCKTILLAKCDNLNCLYLFFIFIYYTRNVWFHCSLLNCFTNLRTHVYICEGWHFYRVFDCVLWSIPAGDMYCLVSGLLYKCNYFVVKLL